MAVSTEENTMMDTPYRVATTTAGGLPGSPDESRPLHTVEQDDVFPR